MDEKIRLMDREIEINGISFTFKELAQYAALSVGYGILCYAVYKSTARTIAKEVIKYLV